MKYIYIKNPYHKTKQIQFDHNTKHTSLIRKPRQKKIPTTQNYNPKFGTQKSNKKIKNKNYKPSNNKFHKIHKSNQRAKGEKITSFIHKPPQKHRGKKKKFEHSITNCWGSG
jgi:hypothetical protein